MPDYNEKIKDDSEDKIDITFKDEEETPARPVPQRRATKKRKTPPQQTRKAIKPKKEEGSTALLVIIIILIIAAGVYLIVTNYSSLNEKPVETMETPEDAVAMVNDEAITTEELDTVYDQLSPQIKLFFDKPAVLERLIDQKLMLQEATTKGIQVTDEEINLSLDILSQSLPPTITLEEFLESQNIAMDDLVEDIRKQVTIAKLLNETIMGDVEVTDEEVEAFYNENIEIYGTYEFAEIQEQLKNELILDRQQQLNEVYLEELRSKATIVNKYMDVIKQDDFKRCMLDKEVEAGTIIFLQDATCGFSNEMVTHVMKQQGEGKSFLTITITEDDEQGILQDCLKPLLEDDMAVPQFICSSSGAILKGNQPETKLAEFAVACE